MANLLPFSSFSPSVNGGLILYDTNMALALVGHSTDPRHAEARAFTATLASQNVYIVTSVKLHEELMILGAFQVLGTRKQQKLTLDSNPSAMAGVETWADNVVSGLQSLPNYYPEPVGEINSTLLLEAKALARKYGLLWGDAVHLAIAQREGINCIATMDGDFSRVTDLNLTVYTDSVNYAKVVPPPTTGASGSST